MTPEELQAELEKRGMTSGKWETRPERTGRPPIINRQIEALQLLRQALEQQQGRALQDLKKARDELTRLRTGGGS